MCFSVLASTSAVVILVRSMPGSVVQRAVGVCQASLMFK